MFSNVVTFVEFITGIYLHGIDSNSKKFSRCNAAIVFQQYNHIYRICRYRIICYFMINLEQMSNVCNLAIASPAITTFCSDMIFYGQIFGLSFIKPRKWDISLLCNSGIFYFNTLHNCLKFIRNWHIAYFVITLRTNAKCTYCVTLRLYRKTTYMFSQNLFRSKILLGGPQRNSHPDI